MGGGAAGLEPLGDRVIVLPDERDAWSGSFYVPEQYRQRPTRGVAAYVGPECDQVRAGDLVLYRFYDGEDVELAGLTFRILRQADVLAVLEPSVEQR